MDKKKMGKTLIIIPARAGSKRIPNKNMVTCAGKPLIYWTIQAVLGAYAAMPDAVSGICVSTDSPDIQAYARSLGVDTPWLRPPELAGDDTPSIDVVAHAMTMMRAGPAAYDPKQAFRWAMLLPPTSPLRTSTDIKTVLQLAQEKDAAGVLSLTRPWHYPVAHSIEPLPGSDSIGSLGIGSVSYLTFLYNLTTARPTMADYRDEYVLNGAIYVIRRDVHSWYTDPCYGYIMPPERSVDIDEPWQLDLADYFLRKQDRGEGGKAYAAGMDGSQTA